MMFHRAVAADNPIRPWGIADHNKVEEVGDRTWGAPHNAVDTCVVDTACKDLGRDVHTANKEVLLRSAAGILEALLLHTWEEGIHTVEEGEVLLVEPPRVEVSLVDHLDEEQILLRQASNVFDLAMPPLLRHAAVVEDEDALAILPEGLRCVPLQDDSLLHPKQQRGEEGVVVPLRLPVLPEAVHLSRQEEQRRLPHFSLRPAERSARRHPLQMCSSCQI
mmetsp:Transcript_19666/g.37243  ORF Transcript_19666/g.37243 Transcript_19666/m.37243 type:complete len:220 (+) Transcript_19666:1270-1929(+)